MRLFSKLFLLLALTWMTVPAIAQERGKATYYAKWMNGRRTASGQRLYNDSLVCAHKTHKFGTLLNVKNLKNGKEVVVKVIDRGPYVKGYIVDLSIAAAREIGLIGVGVVPVVVTVVNKDEKKE